ncbi:hypothetical protein BYT27DRAFT_7069982, partial [Phlegmacium glaucopus]
SRAEKRKARCKEKSKRNNKKRKTKAQHEYREDSKITTKHTRNANATASNYNASNFGIASTGYIGKRAKEQPVAYALGEMVGEDSKFNFELKKWDGRVTIPLLDQEGRIIAVCVGFPEEDDAWPDVQLQAADCLDKARRLLHFKKKEQTNRRGTFLA